MPVERNCCVELHRKAKLAASTGTTLQAWIAQLIHDRLVAEKAISRAANQRSDREATVDRQFELKSRLEALNGPPGDLSRGD